ncbi:hypothetical protein BDA99DRAFT_555821 [Phascolomyces articulosus]|uniref:Uncharacterized protein n=1 Tax=Phascolomyces articulosus TaxID=60185 RepID=A0AAD5K871_9FUNG|nr:hypothetical protein BDA99DRAFT_555821 [Phascolomyces articulosus]
MVDGSSDDLFAKLPKVMAQGDIIAQYMVILEVFMVSLLDKNFWARNCELKGSAMGLNGQQMAKMAIEI